jgi:hypothetical protein
MGLNPFYVSLHPNQNPMKIYLHDNPANQAKKPVPIMMTTDSISKLPPPSLEHFSLHVYSPQGMFRVNDNTTLYECIQTEEKPCFFQKIDPKGIQGWFDPNTWETKPIFQLPVEHVVQRIKTCVCYPDPILSPEVEWVMEWYEDQNGDLKHYDEYLQIKERVKGEKEPHNFEFLSLFSFRPIEQTPP